MYVSPSIIYKVSSLSELISTTGSLHCLLTVYSPLSRSALQPLKRCARWRRRKRALWRCTVAMKIGATRFATKFGVPELEYSYAFETINHKSQ